MQCLIWLFSVVPEIHGFLLCCPLIIIIIIIIIIIYRISQLHKLDNSIRVFLFFFKVVLRTISNSCCAQYVVTLAFRVPVRYNLKFCVTFRTSSSLKGQEVDLA